MTKPIDALISALCAERGETVPPLAAYDEAEKFRFFRALCNVRPPKPVASDFLRLQDAYLQEQLRERGVTALTDLTPVEPDIYLWRGDITTLACDGIVNAANSQMLGCFCPCHGCIDNAIHTYAGVELRLACAEMMKAQGHEEPTGQAKITEAYNLPCKFVLHTVGPIVHGPLTKRHEQALGSCYRSCLALADEKGLKSLAFCCISTGEFHFPNRRAAEIAVQTVKDYKRETNSRMQVIFNVFKELDYDIYSRLLTSNR
jgi:O-acetyl-ADP-ribose deacetylase (regulator of RNase III)